MRSICAVHIMNQQNILYKKIHALHKIRWHVLWRRPAAANVSFGMLRFRATFPTRITRGLLCNYCAALMPPSSHVCRCSVFNPVSQHAHSPSSRANLLSIRHSTTGWCVRSRSALAKTVPEWVWISRTPRGRPTHQFPCASSPRLSFAT